MELTVVAKERAPDGTLLIKLGGDTTAFTFEDCAVGWRGQVLVAVPEEHSRPLQPFRDVTAFQAGVMAALKKSFKRVGEGVADSVRILHADDEGRVVYRLHLETPMETEAQDLQPRCTVRAELVGLRKDAERGRVCPLWRVQLDRSEALSSGGESEVVESESEPLDDDEEEEEDDGAGGETVELEVLAEEDGEEQEVDEWGGIQAYAQGERGSLEGLLEKKRRELAALECRIQKLIESLEGILDMEGEPIGDVMECVEEYKATHAALLG